MLCFAWNHCTLHVHVARCILYSRKNVRITCTTVPVTCSPTRWCLYSQSVSQSVRVSTLHRLSIPKPVPTICTTYPSCTFLPRSKIGSKSHRNRGCPSRAKPNIKCCSVLHYVSFWYIPTSCKKWEQIASKQRLPVTRNWASNVARLGLGVKNAHIVNSYSRWFCGHWTIGKDILNIGSIYLRQRHNNI
jgi:hypothetical protein